MIVKIKDSTEPKPEKVNEAKLVQAGKGVIVQVGGYNIVKISEKGIELIGGVSPLLQIPLDLRGRPVAKPYEP